MNKLNEYGNLSGGYIFDLLDREAHNIAKKRLGNCVTLSGNINFFKEIGERDKFRTIYVTSAVGQNKVYIEAIGYIGNNDIGVMRNFLFIKMK